MNFNVCPFCRDKVHVEESCARPKCMRLHRRAQEEAKQRENGRKAFDLYNATLVNPMRAWKELSRQEQQRWIYATFTAYERLVPVTSGADEDLRDDNQYGPGAL